MFPGWNAIPTDDLLETCSWVSFLYLLVCFFLLLTGSIGRSLPQGFPITRKRVRLRQTHQAFLSTRIWSQSSQSSVGSSQTQLISPRGLFCCRTSHPMAGLSTKQRTRCEPAQPEVNECHVLLVDSSFQSSAVKSQIARIQEDCAVLKEHLGRN